jgi:hypothetical protein
MASHTSRNEEKLLFEGKKETEKIHFPGRVMHIGKRAMIYTTE